MPGVSKALREALESAVGAAGLVLVGDELAYYGTDRCRGGWPVDPSAIVFPRNADQVSAIVRACVAQGVAIVPSGGRTGLAGAATASLGEVVVSMDKMRRILEVDATARWLRAEAGATVEEVRQAAQGVGLMYPIDFAAKGSAQIGGSIATNAGGVNVLRYGMTRAWVMGLSVVLASGERVELGGPLVKDNTGYDLRQLFIGSEGTLGIIVDATLRLCPEAAGRIVALCAVPSDQAVLDLFARVRRSSLLCSAFECFDAGCVRHVLAHRHSSGAGPFAVPSQQHVLIEIEIEMGTEHARDDASERLMQLMADGQDAGEIDDGVLAATRTQEETLWAWREDISESLHRHVPHKADIALPVSRVAEFVVRWREAVAQDLPDVEAVCFGHVGDGNLHLNLLRPPSSSLEKFLEQCRLFDERMYAMVEEFAGSVSAEHGIGLLKRAHLHHTRSRREIEIMRTIKRALDPTGLFNPGKVF